MRAQPLLGPPPLVDEIVTVVDEQLQITEDRLARPRPRKPRLAKRSSCDRERVDRVRLATLTAGPPLGHRQLRRHTHLLLTNREQLPFQPTRQPPAVLERPQPLSAERRGPVDQLSSLPTAMVFSSSIRPASSIATAVTDCLCTSTPITII
jgi:hypothetical protein